MDTALSDLLTCPRCGPTYGLVLLPYEVEDRRVRSGVLGCANCRERYTIEGGVADLRVPGAAVPGPAGTGVGTGAGAEGADGAGVDAAVRLAGLMGLAQARGTVLVAGSAAGHAGELAELVEGVEVVALVAAGLGDPTGEAVRAGVSRVRAGAVLPLRSGSLRGVALTGAWSAALEEGARVLGREGHLVLDPVPSAARARLAEAGLSVVAEEDDVLVAARGS